ncbi:MAG: hypothetical protein AAGF12_08825 [Myxococcota bacterium]
MGKVRGCITLLHGAHSFGVSGTAHAQAVQLEVSGCETPWADFAILAPVVQVELAARGSVQIVETAQNIRLSLQLAGCPDNIVATLTRARGDRRNTRSAELGEEDPAHLRVVAILLTDLLLSPEGDPGSDSPATDSPSEEGSSPPTSNPENGTNLPPGNETSADSVDARGDENDAEAIVANEARSNEARSSEAQALLASDTSETSEGSATEPSPAGTLASPPIEGTEPWRLRVGARGEVALVVAGSSLFAGGGASVDLRRGPLSVGLTLGVTRASSDDTLGSVELLIPRIALTGGYLWDAGVVAIGPAAEIAAGLAIANGTGADDGVVVQDNTTAVVDAAAFVRVELDLNDWLAARLEAGVGLVLRGYDGLAAGRRVVNFTDLQLPFRLGLVFSP